MANSFTKMKPLEAPPAQVAARSSREKAAAARGGKYASRLLLQATGNRTSSRRTSKRNQGGVPSVHPRGSCCLAGAGLEKGLTLQPVGVEWPLPDGDRQTVTSAMRGSRRPLSARSPGSDWRNSCHFEPAAADSLQGAEEPSRASHTPRGGRDLPAVNFLLRLSPASTRKRRDAVEQANPRHVLRGRL